MITIKKNRTIQTAYAWLFATVWVVAACTPDEQDEKHGIIQGNEYSIKILPMSYSLGASQRSAQEELPNGLSVTYDREIIEQKPSTRGGIMTLAEESSISFMDVYNIAEKMTPDYESRFYHQRVNMDELKGPFIGGISSGYPFYYYETYLMPVAPPLGYEMIPYGLITANFDELILDTDRDFIDMEFTKNTYFESEADITPNGKLLFSGEINFEYDRIITLTRVNAKIDVRVNIQEDSPDSDLETLKITSIRLRNAPRTYGFPFLSRNPLLFDENGPVLDCSITETEKDSYYMDYAAINGDDIGRNGEDDRFVWYVLPNYNHDDSQGQSSSEKGKTVENAPESYLPTYVELAGTYLGKDIIIRVCPGDNTYNDYSIWPNYWYRININIINEIPYNDPRIVYEWPPEE